MPLLYHKIKMGSSFSLTKGRVIIVTTLAIVVLTYYATITFRIANKSITQIIKTAVLKTTAGLNDVIDPYLNMLV